MIILPSLPRVGVQIVDVPIELPALMKLGALCGEGLLAIELDHDLILQRGEFRASGAGLIEYAKT